MKQSIVISLKKWKKQQKYVDVWTLGGVQLVQKSNGVQSHRIVNNNTQKFINSTLESSSKVKMAHAPRFEMDK